MSTVVGKQSLGVRSGSAHEGWSVVITGFSSSLKLISPFRGVIYDKDKYSANERSRKNMQLVLRFDMNLSLSKFRKLSFGYCFVLRVENFFVCV